MAEQAGTQAHLLSPPPEQADAGAPAPDNAAARPLSAPAQALAADLARAPYEFDFHQAVRRLESAHPDKPRIGTSHRAVEDPVRFGQDPSMAFAPAEILSVTSKPGGKQRLGVAFMGCLGPNGPLPLHLTAYARDRALQAKDWTLVHFLDLLTHRFISLFHRAWAVNQKTVCFDRPRTDRFTSYFGSIGGLGQPALRNRDRLPDVVKLFYIGRLAPQVKSASGLRDILADYLGVAVTIEQFIGQWVELPDDCKCRLGESPSTGQLGRTLIVGSRMWDCQMKFRVRLGPLRLRDFERFLPGQPGLRRVHDWINLYTAGELDWDIQLILRRDEVPQIRLGQAGRLGWTTWIGTRTQPTDADEVILSSTVAAA